MQINISARHGHLGTETQEKIGEKVDKLRRIFDRLTAAHVTVDLKDRDAPNVELRVSLAHSGDLFAHCESIDVMSGLDSALHKVEQQLRKHKEKLTGRRSTGLKHLEVPVDIETEPEREAG